MSQSALGIQREEPVTRLSARTACLQVTQQSLPAQYVSVS